jgi:hypothetical protein
MTQLLDYADLRQRGIKYSKCQPALAALECWQISQTGEVEHGAKRLARR